MPVKEKAPAKPKVAIATVEEMESLIRERQGYHISKKIAETAIAKLNPIIYSNLARMEDGTSLLVSDSRIGDDKVWKCWLGGAKRTTVNLDALKKSMLAHSVPPKTINSILADSQEVTDGETGETKIVQVVKETQSDSVNVRMVNRKE